MHVCLHVHTHVYMLGCLRNVTCPVMHTNESITRDGETRPVMTQPFLNNPTLRTIYTHAYARTCTPTPTSSALTHPARNLPTLKQQKQVCDAQQKLPFEKAALEAELAKKSRSLVVGTPTRSVDANAFLQVVKGADDAVRGKIAEIVQQTNRLIMTVPEVLTAHGKAGRAETATDPAPLEMVFLPPEQV